MPKNKNWKSVSINAEFYKVIEKFVANSPNYESIAEFVREALRLRLEALANLGVT